MIKGKRLVIALLFTYVLALGFNFLGANMAGAQSTNTAEPSVSDLKLSNPLSVDSIEGLIGKLLKPVLGVMGSLALIMFVYGGLMWMTSAGSSEKLKKGRETLLWAAIGLFVVLSSYTLVTITINTILN